MNGTRLIEPGAPRERIVLSMLLLDMGKVVPIERLIDAVWDDSPPRTARTQIQICVSSLRQRLMMASRSPAIATRHPGYAVVPHEWRLDADVFEERVAVAQAAVDDGDHAGAAEGLRSALAMWRGEPFAGVGSRLVQASTVRLRERKLLVAEDWAELELELGHQESIIGPHFELVLEHPYQERLHEQLMLALYRSGRSADALEVFRSIRRVLADDLGIAPGERLRRLERAILTDDAGVRAAGATRHRQARVVPDQGPHQLPADVGDFTGQADLIAEVERALTFPETAPEQRPRGMRIVAIAGAGGIGKTACAVHVAHRIAYRFPDGQLHVDLRGGEPVPADPAWILERFLVALGVPAPAVPDDVDERLDLYRSLVSDRRMLIILDNAASEGQLLPLLPGSSTCAVLVTARRRITGLPGVKVRDADVLDPDTAVSFLAKTVGEDRVRREPEAARLLADRCDGLPLALRVAGARLAARPHWTIAGFAERLADVRRRLDELRHEHLNVRTVLSSMFDGLAPGPARLVLALSLLETLEFPGWVAAALLDLPARQAQEYLEELIDAQLVHVIGGAADGERYRMRGLIRSYALERCEAAVPPSGRTEMIARVLSGWLVLAERAQAAESGRDAALVRRVPRHWSPDDRVADRVSADPVGWMTAERHALDAAVRLAADAGMPDKCWALALVCAGVHEVLGASEDWREIQRLALAVARDAGDTAGEAAVLGRGTADGQARQDSRAAANLLAALNIARDVGERFAEGRALLALGRLRAAGGDSDSALRYLRAAQEVFDDLSVPRWRARAEAAVDLLDGQDGHTYRVAPPGAIADRKRTDTR